MNDRQSLSRVTRVERSTPINNRNLSRNADLPAYRDVRAYAANAASRHFHRVEHSGRARAAQPNETLHFLSIARGSLQELETQTLIATDLEYLDPAQAEPLLHQMAEVIRLLQGFIRYYEHRAG
jgi:hypothetical protein